MDLDGYPVDSPNYNRRGLNSDGTAICSGRVSESDTHLDLFVRGFLPVRLRTGIKRALATSEIEVKMQDQVFTFANSPFVPVAIGFFGLGTGYFIWGGQALFGFPKSSP